MRRVSDAANDSKLWLVLAGIIGVVGYSRVRTGVHYPGDVVVGALIGTTIGESVAFGARAWRRRH